MLSRIVQKSRRRGVRRRYRNPPNAKGARRIGGVCCANQDSGELLCG